SKPRPARFPPRPAADPGIPVPLPLGATLNCVLGQSADTALCGERLLSGAAHHVPRHHQGRSTPRLTIEEGETMAVSKKVALVTGSATGVGAATCRKLSGLGWNVVVNYSRSKNEAEETAAQCRTLGADVLVCQADVAKDADCRRLVDETVKKFGRLDALVSSAGYTKFVHHADLEEMTSEEFLKTLSINLLGPFQVSRAAVPHLKASGNAAIVFV